MNLNGFQITLQDAINKSTTTIDYLLLAKAVQKLNMGQTRRVSTLGDLPSASTNTGLLIYVVSEEAVYYSNGTIWKDLATNA
jgi:hypothetical protein